MTLFRVLLTILLFVSPILAQRYPVQVKKSVMFIFAKDTADRLSVQGTGFFLLVNANQNTDTASFGYIVTTKTALRSAAGQYLETLYVRINRKDGSSDTLMVPMNVNGIPRYFVHPDSAVDLALIPAFPDVSKYDMLYIPAGMIGTVDLFARENIAEGNEVFHIGLVPAHIGVFKNIPSVQFGRIMQMSAEKYRWANSVAEFILVESDFSPKSTGAPVYYYAEPSKDSAGIARSAKLFLCGVLAGTFELGKEHSRIARIIPAYILTQMLNQPDVAGERNKEFSRIRRNAANK